MTVTLISCGVFKDALEDLEIEAKNPHLQVLYLPARLHLWPQELKQKLTDAIQKLQARRRKCVCLYGECFQDIDDVVAKYESVRIPGVHCFEILLGKKRFQKIMQETAGTFFLERELVENFVEYCVKPLELDDEEMRRSFFKHYRRLIYIRQPRDADLIPTAEEIANFLELPLDVEAADYTYLKTTLVQLIK